MAATSLLKTFKCVVIDPGRQEFEAAASRAGMPNVYFGPAEYVVTYPDDFPGAVLQPGTYQIEWHEESPFFVRPWGRAP